MKRRLRASSLRRQLSGSDRRSIGQVPTVVREVLRQPPLISALVDALEDADAVVRMRAADALEKVTAAHPHLLGCWTTQVLRVAGNTDQQEVRWHLAQIVPRLQLTQRQRAAGMRALQKYLSDPSSIVRTFTLQALADLSEGDKQLRRGIDATLAAAARTGTPAMRARARRILAHRAKNRARTNGRFGLRDRVCAGLPEFSRLRRPGSVPLRSRRRVCVVSARRKESSEPWARVRPMPIDK